MKISERFAKHLNAEMDIIQAQAEIVKSKINLVGLTDGYQPSAPAGEIDLDFMLMTFHGIKQQTEIMAETIGELLKQLKPASPE